MTVREVVYDAEVDNFDISKDPRCLWGWGPPGAAGCRHARFGHSCIREFGHPGRCVDSQPPRYYPCETSQRPKDWDTAGRAEANR